MPFSCGRDAANRGPERPAYRAGRPGLIAVGRGGRGCGCSGGGPQGQLPGRPRLRLRGEQPGPGRAADRAGEPPPARRYLPAGGAGGGEGPIAASSRGHAVLSWLLRSLGGVVQETAGYRLGGGHGVTLRLWAKWDSKSWVNWVASAGALVIVKRVSAWYMRALAVRLALPVMIVDLSITMYLW